MNLYLIAKSVLHYAILCMVLYMLTYMLAEKHLAKHLKESVFLKIMPLSNRITAFVITYVLCLGPLHIANLIRALARSEKPQAYTLLFVSVWSFVMYACIRHRVWRWNWYYLTKPNRTILTHWHMQKYFAAAEKKKVEEAYHHLQKASELKTDSVFIWSLLALYNEFDFEKSELADEYLAKARQTLATLSNATAKDKALVEAITGEILLRRHQVDEGLACLKAACDLDASGFKEKYDRALQRANEPDNEDDASEPPEPEHRDVPKTNEPEFPDLLDSASWLSIVFGVIVVLFPFASLSWFILSGKFKPVHHFPWPVYWKHLLAAIYGILLFASGKWCLERKKIGWHLMSFFSLLTALWLAKFVQFLLPREGLDHGILLPIILCLLFTAAYVYLFTDAPRAFLNVVQPKRWQMFSLHIALYVLLHLLFNILRGQMRL